MPSGTPSMTRTPFTDSDDRDLVAFLAVQHPSKEGRMGNAVYKLLTEQPSKWPWGKRHTWMSWRERYKNHEARFDHHIKAFQNKNKLSKRAVPVGFEAMLVSGMEDLDDFGTDEEEEDQRPHGKRTAHVDSDSDHEDDEDTTKPHSGPSSEATTVPKQPVSKRKRVSDTNDRTPKRSKVAEDNGSGDFQEGSPTNRLTDEAEDDAMDQDSQGEETLEVEQNLFYPSDEDSLTAPLSHSKSRGGSTPKRSTHPPRSGGTTTTPSKGHHTPRPREPVHRPHSPKHPPSSPFSTVDLDGSETDTPIIPRHVRKRTVPKIVESAFGRNEQFIPVRSSQTRADSSPEFDLLVERRAARKAMSSKDLEIRSTGDGMTQEELRDLQISTPEPGPSSSSTSKRGSVEPRGSLPPSQPTPLLRPRPPPSTRMDATEKKMIEAREELSKLALKFRDKFPRSPLGIKSPAMRMKGDKTRPFNESTHPFDETTHPFDETMHSFDQTTHPFDDSQTQQLHPFDEDSRAPTQEPNPFDENTRHQGLEVPAPDVQVKDSPVPSTPGSSKRRTDAFLTQSLLESRRSRVSSIDRLRPRLLSPPNNSLHFPKDLAANESTTPDGFSRRQKAPTPTTTSRSAIRSPRSPEHTPILSPRRARAGGVTPEQGRPRSTATQELRELLENSPRTRRTSANIETHPQTHEKPPMISERKSKHKTRFSEPSVKSEITTPGYHLRSKSMVDDDPFSSPAGLRLSSPHPQADATIPDDEQQSPLAPRTTSQRGLDATIKSRQVRRETVQDRNRRVRDSEQLDSSRSLEPTSIASNTLRRGKGVVRSPAQAGIEEDVDAMDVSQTYDTGRDLYDVAETPMMDLSFRPPRRIPPTYRASSHTRHRTSSTVNSRDYDLERERDRDGRKSSRHPEREVERDAREEREQPRDSKRLSGISFGSPIAVSSPPNVRRNSYGPNHDKQDKNTLNTSTSSKTSIGSSTSTTSTAMGIMAGPLGLGFAPSEMDAYLGIQIACEKIAKTHGFQSDAVVRVYQEVKDLRKAEEIVIGMKCAAEKDAIERIMKVREKTERKKMSEEPGESSSNWGKDVGRSRASRQSYDSRHDGEDDQEVTDRSIIYEEDEDDPDSPMRVEHLSNRNKRSSTSSTSALRQRGGYDRPRTSTTTIKMRERDQAHNVEGSLEYHPPTPTRANLWERLSKSGRHPEAALLGESMRASRSMLKY